MSGEEDTSEVCEAGELGISFGTPTTEIQEMGKLSEAIGTAGGGKSFSRAEGKLEGRHLQTLAK